jgi:hypothetical protein
MLSKPQRDLLQQLVFRWPNPCYLVITQRGFHALVVTSMLRSKSLHRMPRGFMRATTMDLANAGLITLEDYSGDIPRYGYRVEGDTGHGWLVAITEAGRAAIGATSEAQQRRAQVIAAREGIRRTAAASRARRRRASDE